DDGGKRRGAEDGEIHGGDYNKKFLIDY
ncbi:MAG: hypothetical protein G01um101416_1208, partial [Microgenomates group bacterium Gr01-1014_16]